MSQRFNLTREHLRLLREANVCWDSCETGAPAIDPKRPYGNSDVAADVCKTLGWKKLGDDGYGPCWSSHQQQLAMELHAGTETALAILCNLAGEAAGPGLYQLVAYRHWRQIGPPAPESDR
jgi:hypothetical protein